jgi:hypothetical protein
MPVGPDNHGRYRIDANHTGIPVSDAGAALRGDSTVVRELLLKSFPGGSFRFVFGFKTEPDGIRMQQQPAGWCRRVVRLPGRVVVCQSVLSGLLWLGPKG